MKKPHVFVVDDSEVTREAIKGLLEKKNYTVTAFEDGSLALRKVKELQPDLVLLDVIMPYMDGLGFIEELRCVDVPQPQIIVISSKKELSDIMLENGVRYFIVKPYAAQDLLEKVKDCLG